MEEEVLLCPYRTQTVTFHKTRDNRQLPPIGWNGKIDHDVQNIYFLPCIRKQCAMYDAINEICGISTKPRP